MDSRATEGKGGSRLLHLTGPFQVAELTGSPCVKKEETRSRANDVTIIRLLTRLFSFITTEFKL